MIALHAFWVWWGMEPLMMMGLWFFWQILAIMPEQKA